MPLSFFFFAIIGNENVSFLQFMGIFIIMGIGADDIFVFMDSYRQSLRLADHEHDAQFHAAYKRAASAMLVTSSTSGCAFFATAISPIPAVSAFGVTMAFMVLLNYALVMTWFPAGVLIFHRCGWSSERRRAEQRAIGARAAGEATYHGRAPPARAKKALLLLHRRCRSRVLVFGGSGRRRRCRSFQWGRRGGKPPEPPPRPAKSSCPPCYRRSRSTAPG